MAESNRNSVIATICRASPTSPCNASTMKLQLRYDVHGSAERFWEVFFDPEVTRRLHLEALRSTSVEIEEQTGDVATGLDRTIRYGQKPDAPGPVKKLFGSEVITTEHGTFDPKTGIWSFTLTPATLGEKTEIRGSIEIKEIAATEGGAGAEAAAVDADTDRDSTGTRCEQIFLLEAKVKIFGAGPVVERFIEKQARDTQDRAAAFFNRILDGDG